MNGSKQTLFLFILSALLVFSALGASRFDEYHSMSKDIFGANIDSDNATKIANTIITSRNGYGMPNYYYQTTKLSIVSAAWIKHDLNGALDYITKTKPKEDPVSHGIIFALALDSAANLSGISQMDKRIPAQWRESYRNLMARRVGLNYGSDVPKEVLDFILSDSSMVEDWSTGFSKRDPVACLIFSEQCGAFEKTLKDDACHNIQYSPREEIFRYLQSDDSLAYSILFNLADYSPVDAYTIALRLDTPFSNIPYSRIFETWASADPQKAAQALLSSDYSDELQNRVGGEVLVALFESNLDDARSFLLSLNFTYCESAYSSLLRESGLSERGAVVASLLQDLALTHADRIGLNPNSNPLMEGIKEWAKVDFDAAVTWIEAEAEPGQADACYSGLVAALATEDVAYAQSLYERIASPGVRMEVAGLIAESLFEQDPEEGLEWLKTISQDINARMTVEYFFSNWGDLDIRGAIQHFPRDQSLRFQKSAMRGLGQCIGYLPADEYFGWLQTVPADVSKLVAERTVDHFGKDKPIDVARFLSQNEYLQKDSQSWRLLGMLTADVDPASALALLNEASPLGRGSMLEGIATTMLKHNRLEMVAWMESLPDQGDKDLALRAYVDERRMREPEVCYEYALQVKQRKGVRRDAISKAVESLANADRDYALFTLRNDSRLSDEERAFALAYLEHGEKLPHQ